MNVVSGREPEVKSEICECAFVETAANVTQLWQRYRRRLLFFAAAGLGVWIVFFATGPAYQDAQVSVIDAGGTEHEFTLWRKDPIVPFPFHDTPNKYVGYGNHRFKIHGN